MAEFVFDESSYIRALYSERTQRDVDQLAARLLQRLQVEHCWILSNRILVAYHRQFKKHVTERGVVSSALIRSLRDVQRDPTSSRFISGLQPVPGDFDHNDDHIVEAAAAIPSCKLITLDEKLLVALAKERIPARYGFEAIDVPTAWDQLCRPH